MYKRIGNGLPALGALAGVLLLAGCLSAGVTPANMVEMTEVVGPGATKDLRSGPPEGTAGSIYRVPDGMVLVLTRAIIQPMTPGSGTVDITFMQSGGGLPDRIRQTWRMPRTQPTEYDFTPGQLVSAGSTLKIRNNAGGGGEIAVILYGYVAAAP